MAVELNMLADRLGWTMGYFDSNSAHQTDQSVRDKGNDPPSPNPKAYTPDYREPAGAARRKAEAA